MSNIKLESKTINVLGEYDVIVAGGGTAGAIAAISCGKQNLKTLVIEHFGALGGSATMSLVTPIMHSHIFNNPAHSAISIEVNERLRACGAADESGRNFDPTLLKCVLEDCVLEYGCDLLYHTTIVDVVKENNTITHVLVANKDGLTAYKAKCFIDCTGDGDLAVYAGVDYEIGDHNGVNQPVSLRFEVSNIDYDKFHKFAEGLGIKNTYYIAMNSPGIAPILQKAYEDGVMKLQDIKYFQGFGMPGKPHSMSFNCPELTTQADVADAKFLTQKQIQGKKAILRTAQFLKSYIPGFEESYITEIAPMVGIRESRRIDAVYNLTTEDILSYKKFEDGINASNYPVDVHGYDDVSLGLTYTPNVPAEERYWEIPFRCMVPKKVTNLLVAGRCAGFDFIAQSAARVQHSCRSMGEAAGIGCKLAIESNKPMQEINFAAVKEKMDQDLANILK